LSVGVVNLVVLLCKLIEDDD